MAVVYPKEGRKDDLRFIILDSGKLGMFKNDLVPDLDTEWVDLTPADYGGYAAVTPAWGAIGIDGDDNASTTCTEIEFSAPGSGSPQNLYGWVWYYQDLVSGNKIRRIERFSDAPRAFGPGSPPIRITLTVTQGDCPP